MDDQLRARRKAGLQVFTAVVDVGAAVLLSGVLVAGMSYGAAAAWAAGIATLAGVAVAVLRCVVPARARPRGPEPAADEDVGDEKKSSVVERIVLTVLVSLTMGLMLLLACWLIVLIVLGFALASPGATLTGVAAALVASIAVSAVAELGAVRPLLKRWDIAED